MPCLTVGTNSKGDKLLGITIILILILIIISHSIVLQINNIPINNFDNLLIQRTFKFALYMQEDIGYRDCHDSVINSSKREGFDVMFRRFISKLSYNITLILIN